MAAAKLAIELCLVSKTGLSNRICGNFSHPNQVAQVEEKHLILYHESTKRGV